MKLKMIDIINYLNEEIDIKNYNISIVEDTGDSLLLSIEDKLYPFKYKTSTELTSEPIISKVIPWNRKDVDLFEKVELKAITWEEWSNQ